MVEGDPDGTDVTIQRPSADSHEHFASVEADAVRNKHGIIAGWKHGVYDFASDTPDLYDVLIDQEQMLPDQP